jgi:hypothetical protein
MTANDFQHLLGAADRDELDHRWTAIETGFVEDPQRHVELADQLLGEVITRLQAHLQSDRDRLSGAWRGSDVTTEQLRELLLRYRAAYDRLRAVVVPQ